MLDQRDVERISFGCGNFGGIGSSPRLRGAGDSEEQALELLDHARRVGILRFDTANTYGGGASETILGKWLRSQGRDFLAKAKIATKVGNPHGCRPGETPLSAAEVTHHLDESLERLGVDRIDLYYIHEFDHVTPLDATLGAMARAFEAGKIASFGISNASLSDIEAVSIASSRLGLRLEYVQNEYNLLATKDVTDVIPCCASKGVRYIAFSPLAGGFLTGKYRPGEAPPAGSRLAEAPAVCAAYQSDEALASIERLRQLAGERQLSMGEAALRFVLGTKGVDGLVIAPRRIEHFSSLGLHPS
jgi:aryl-alcohol dehydrogenase-like predicted oxidoreductase